jgi:hypothetical protein
LCHGSQHTLVELPEAIPGDRRLERLDHQPEPGESLAQVRAAQERRRPDRSGVAVLLAHLAAVPGADLPRPGQPRAQLMIGGLKAQHQDRA